MKCNDCLNLLEEYIDGEVVEHEAEQISAHLITCARCSNEFEALTAEQEVYARYDRELDVSPAMWNVIAARTGARDSRPDSSLRGWLTGLFAAPRIRFALPAMAVVIIAVVLGVVYLRMQQQATPSIAKVNEVGPTSPPDNAVAVINGPPRTEAFTPVNITDAIHMKVSSKSNLPARKSRAADEPDVLFSDYSDIEDKETADHVEQAQNLLRSIRNIQLSDDDDEIDVTHEKAMSRRLLNENVVLRRDAEMSGKFPAKTLLGDLEPFLIDIANLPDKTTSSELRVIKDRVQRTEIVAALQGY